MNKEVRRFGRYVTSSVFGQCNEFRAVQKVADGSLLSVFVAAATRTI